MSYVTIYIYMYTVHTVIVNMGVGHGCWTWVLQLIGRLSSPPHPNPHPTEMANCVAGFYMREWLKWDDGGYNPQKRAPYFLNPQNLFFYHRENLFF